MNTLDLKSKLIPNLNNYSYMFVKSKTKINFFSTKPNSFNSKYQKRLDQNQDVLQQFPHSHHHQRTIYKYIKY